MAESVETMTCPVHGAYEPRAWRLGAKELKSDRCPKCEEKARVEREQAEERAEHDRRLKLTEIPLRFADATFDTFKAETDAQVRAKDICAGYAKNFNAHAAAGRCLALVGNVGTGKTHLSCAILRELYRRPVRYMTAAGAIREVRSAWGGQGQESEKYRGLANLELLVLDEVGVQHKTESEQVILTEIFNMRYERMRPTIVVSNLDLEGVKAVIGERAFDRLRENGGIAVPFVWPSQRGRV